MCIYIVNPDCHHLAFANWLRQGFSLPKAFMKKLKPSAPYTFITDPIWLECNIMFKSGWKVSGRNPICSVLVWKILSQMPTENLTLELGEYKMSSPSLQRR